MTLKKVFGSYDSVKVGNNFFLVLQKNIQFNKNHQSSDVESLPKS